MWEKPPSGGVSWLSTASCQECQLPVHLLLPLALPSSAPWRILQPAGSGEAEYSEGCRGTGFPREGGRWLKALSTHPSAQIPSLKEYSDLITACPCCKSLFFTLYLNLPVGMGLSRGHHPATIPLFFSPALPFKCDFERWGVGKLLLEESWGAD